jgi:hypothetical protein
MGIGRSWVDCDGERDAGADGQKRRAHEDQQRQDTVPSTKTDNAAAYHTLPADF